MKVIHIVRRVAVLALIFGAAFAFLAATTTPAFALSAMAVILPTIAVMVAAIALWDIED